MTGNEVVTLSAALAQDLRNSTAFSAWAESLPVQIREVLRLAVMTYYAFDDTICIMWPVRMGPAVRQTDMCDRLTRLVASVYDRNRQAWIADRNAHVTGDVPPCVVMPRLHFVVAPAWNAGH